MCADITEIREDGSPPAGAAGAAGAEGGAEAPGAAGAAGHQGQQGLQAGSSRKDNPSLHNLPHSLQEIPPVSMI